VDCPVAILAFDLVPLNALWIAGRRRDQRRAVESGPRRA
jgi:hypothetical protein